MDTDLFEYEMKRKGFKTSKQRANALSMSMSAYYRRIKHSTECTVEDMAKIVDLLGWEVTRRIFFGNQVS